MADAIAIKQLSATIGAEVLDVDRNRLLNDPAVPGAILDALEAHGVLLFREIGLDDEDQVAFGRRLGELVVRPGNPVPEINVITQTPDDPRAEYFKGNAQWHIDGTSDEIPAKAGILTAKVMSTGDSGTEFASTYAAHDDLTDEEKKRLTGLRVMHSIEATLSRVTPDPTPEQLAVWRARPPREHPLVWHHRSGRTSLVLGATADHIVGMDRDEGRALLDDLVERGDASRARCAPRLDRRRHGHLGQHRRPAPRHRPQPDVDARAAPRDDRR